jgi:hypothetical protein
MATTDTQELTTEERDELEELLAVAEPTEEQALKRDALMSKDYGQEVRAARVLNVWMATVRPHEGQFAVLARLRSAARMIETIPDAERMDSLVRVTGSVGTALQSFFADPDDHETIEGALLSRRMGWRESLDLFDTVFHVWNDEEQVAPNRADKRRAAKRV